MKSYANLTKAFGIENNTTGSITLRSALLYFVRSGYYDYNNGNIGNLGSLGYYWSSTASATTRTYRLSFDGSNVHPQSYNYSYRGYGFSLRCVAR